MSQFEQDKQAEQNEARRVENLKVFHAWAGKHPELPRNTAGGIAMSVEKLFQEYMDFTDPNLSEEDFEFAFGNLASHIALSHVPTAQEINRERRAMSVTELRELSKVENPPLRPDDLPLEITLPGCNTPTSIATRRDLLDLAKTNFREFKKLCERYGSSAINKRMGVKPTLQPGYGASLNI